MGEQRCKHSVLSMLIAVAVTGLSQERYLPPVTRLLKVAPVAGPLHPQERRLPSVTRLLKAVPVAGPPHPH